MLLFYFKMTWINLQSKSYKLSLVTAETKQVVSLSGAISWPMQQSAEAMCSPHRQQHSTETKMVHITWVPLWCVDNTPTIGANRSSDGSNGNVFAAVKQGKITM